MYLIEIILARSPYPDVDIPEQNVADFVFADVDKYGDLPALCCGMTGRQYTYEMFRDSAVKFGSALRRLGAKKSDVVAFLLPNIPEFPIAFLGCVGAGLTVTTINPTYKAEEIARQLENSGAKYIITIGIKLTTFSKPFINDFSPERPGQLTSLCFRSIAAASQAGHRQPGGHQDRGDHRAGWTGRDPGRLQELHESDVVG